MAGLQDIFDEFLGYGITSVYNSLTSSKAIQAYRAAVRCWRPRRRPYPSPSPPAA